MRSGLPDTADVTDGEAFPLLLSGASVSGLEELEVLEMT